METLKALLHYQIMGTPVWAWALFGMPVINEAINRSKWTKAQSVWQFCWRIVAATPLARIPLVGQVIVMMAIPKDQRSNTSLPPPVMPGPSVLILLVMPVVFGGCATLEMELHKAVAAAAKTGTACFQLVDAADREKQRVLLDRVKEPTIQQEFDDWRNLRSGLMMGCRSAQVAAETADALIPSIIAAKDKKNEATAWIARLVKLTFDVMAALDKAGLTTGGMK